MIQATYHDVGLTPEDVIELEQDGKLGAFRVKPRDDNVHIMLYPKKYSGSKIQVLNNSANIWVRKPAKLGKIEMLLNKVFEEKLESRCFKKPKIILCPGELRKIADTPLGMICTLAYYYRPQIKTALNEVLQNMDKWSDWARKT